MYLIFEMNCLPNELKIIIVSYIDRPFDFLKSCAKCEIKKNRLVIPNGLRIKESPQQ